MKLKLAATTLFSTALCASHAPAKDSYISFILDRSQSMEELRVDGRSRCATSKAFTKQTLNALYNHYSKEGNVYINLLLFGSPGGQLSLTQGYSRDKSQVLAAIDRLGDEDCAHGSTALADAMCNVANGLRTFTSGLDVNLQVFGITDGEENASSFRECGPNLASGWQDYLKSKFKDEKPRITYNAAIFTGEDIRSQESEANEPIPRSATFDFLMSLARETGGTVTIVNDKDASPPEQFPLPTTETLPLNGFQTVKFIKDSLQACVDVATFALVMHGGDNNVKRVDDLTGNFLQTTLTAQHRDCSLQIICAQAPNQGFTALSYQRLCASNQFAGDLDGKLMQEFDANLNLY